MHLQLLKGIRTNIIKEYGNSHKSPARVHNMIRGSGVEREIK